MAVNVPINFFANVQNAAAEFGKLTTVLKLVGAAFAADKILDGIESITDAAADAERASQKMASSLKLAGDFSEQNVKAFEDLAEQIQANSKFDDDLVLSQVAIAKQFGATNEEAQELIKAAVDLASATDMDLGTAVKTLGQTLDGTAGRVGEMIPAVASLTSEQLAAGDAIALVAARFAGAAKDELQTFNGAMAQLKNNVGNLIEGFGDVIVRNDAVKVAIRAATQAFIALGEIFNENKVAITQFVAQGVILAIDAIGVFIEMIRVVDQVITAVVVGVRTLASDLSRMGQALANLATGDFKKAFSFDAQSFEKLNTAIEKDISSQKKRFEFYDRINTAIATTSFEAEKAAEKQALIAKETENTASGFDKLSTKVKRVNKDLIDEFKSLESSIKTVGATERDVLVSQLNAGLDTVRKALADGVTNRERANAAIEKLTIRFNKGITDIEKKEADERKKILEDETRAHEQEIKDRDAFIKQHYENLKKLAADPLGGLFDGSSNLLGLTTAVQEAVASGLGGFGLILQGGAGAKKLLGGIAEGLGQAFLGVPGFGALFESLAAGPDQVRTMVREFAAAVPDIIQAVIEAIPVLIEEINAAIPEIIERLVERAPDIIDRLVDRAPQIIEKMVRVTAEKMPGIFLKAAINMTAKMYEGIITFIDKLISGSFDFVGRIVAGAGDFIMRIGQGAIDFVGNIISGAGRFIEELIKGLTGGLTGGGGGGTIIPGAPNIIPDSVPIIGGWFAEGGLVPPGFPNDSFPARLTSGEQVIDRTDNERLSRFLDREERGSGQPTSITIQIGEEQLARILLNLNRRGFRTA